MKGIDLSKIEIQGHRGCRGLLPENSLPAFEKAISLGVHAIELDIAVTKANEIVVSHEPFMSRITCLKPGGTEITEAEDMIYNLYKMSHEEIKCFDCGTKRHVSYPDQIKIKVYKPLLSEVFNLVLEKNNTQVKLNIELKSKPKYYGIFTPYPKEYVALVLKTIKDYGFKDRCNLQSFDLNILEEINKQDPSISIALLVDEDENIEDKLKKLSFKPTILSPYYKLLSKTLVVKYQSINYRVIPWTVNEDSDLKRMMSFGVNAIITDYPNRLKTLIDTKRLSTIC